MIAPKCTDSVGNGRFLSKLRCVLRQTETSTENSCSYEPSRSLSIADYLSLTHRISESETTAHRRGEATPGEIISPLLPGHLAISDRRDDGHRRFCVGWWC